jgi:hypothetical protein
MTSRVAIALDGSTRLFSVPFPFIHQSHVIVAVNLVAQFQAVDFDWVSDTAIQFKTAPQGVLTLYRKTPIDEALVSFRNGATLTEDELNLAVLQNLYASQELRDLYETLINGGIDRLVTNLGGTAGSVIDQVIAEVLTSEQLADLQQHITDIDTNAETINTQRIRLDTVEETVDALANVDGTSITTFLLDEQNARIEGDTAINETLDIMGAKSGDGLGFVFNMDAVKVSPTESLATRLAGLRASVDSATATIASEQTTRANADSALATSVSNVNTRVANAETLITSETTARSSADSALGTRIDGLLSTVNSNTALILAEQTTRANADSAEATARQTLQTQVNGNTASISTQATTLNGLTAQYSVKLDVNGYITGFGLYNSAGSSQFLILADKFALVTPGASPVVPFAADAGGVYMNTAYIRNLVVDKIAGGSIQTQWNLNNTNGRIVLDTGTYMKVIGVGFGMYSDLIEWFGPKMAISACTKANAITYVAMNGDAYFGGSLSAGTLYNAAQTTSTTAPTSAVIGPFASNGHSKTVVVSYSYLKADPDGASVGTGTGGTVTVKLYRQLGVGTEALLATYTVVCDKFSDPNGNGTYDVQEAGSGSWTYTDTNTYIGDYTYRVEVATRTGMAAIASGGNSVFTQRAGAVITEE